MPRPEAVRQKMNELAAESPSLFKQMGEYFDLQQERFVNRGMPAEKAETLMSWTEGFTSRFLLSRLRRAKEVASDQIKSAGKLEDEFIGKGRQHFMVGCMDGRNIPAIMLSHVPHVGGVIRTQGGDIFGISRASDPDKFIVKDDAFIYQRIRDLLLHSDGDIIHYSFDSHFGCAAKGDIHSNRGHIDDDDGLREDIKRKIVIARWLKSIHTDLAGKTADISDIKPQFFSYRPKDGTLTMGLELHVDEVKRGFTPEAIDELKQNGKIVDTWEFLNDTEVSSVLEGTVKPANFRERFAQSMLNNWQSISTIYEGGNSFVFRKIYERLESIYTGANWQVGEVDDIDGQKISREVLTNKAKIMLKNLVTRWSVGKNGKDWPFDKHVEQAVVLTEGGYGPFGDIDVFSVFSREDDLPLLDHTFKSIDLVRKFRRGGNIKDALEMLERDEFTEAPIIIFNKAIARGVEEETWKELLKLDFTAIWSAFKWDNNSINWERNDLVNFISERAGKTKLNFSFKESHKFYDAVYEIFHRARIMMRESTKFNEPLLDGNLMLINLITDKDRRARLIVPIPV